MVVVRMFVCFYPLSFSNCTQGFLSVEGHDIHEIVSITVPAYSIRLLNLDSELQRRNCRLS